MWEKGSELYQRSDSEFLIWEETEDLGGDDEALVGVGDGWSPASFVH
jgi:hypothetical protein